MSVMYGKGGFKNHLDFQILFKKKDETEDYDQQQQQQQQQQSKLAQHYARLDPTPINSAMDEPRQYQVRLGPSV